MEGVRTAKNSEAKESEVKRKRRTAEEPIEISLVFIFVLYPSSFFLRISRAATLAEAQARE